MPSPAVLTPADMSKIMRALHACSGLRELEVLRDRSMPVGDSIQSWVLEGHTFKLSKFTNTYFDAHSLVGFLVQQSGIRTLVLKSSPTSSLPASILPNLTTIDTFAAIIRQIGNSAWEQDRSLQHMQYQMSHSFDDEELSTFVTLSRFSDTLTSLSIHRVSGGLGLDIAIVAACVAAQLPELKFFQFLDDTQSPHITLVPLLPFPVRFNRIETMVLKPAVQVWSDQEDAPSLYPEINTSVGRFQAADRIMTNFPTLKRLVIILSKAHSFFRSEHGGVDDGGVIELEESMWMNA